MNERAGCGRPDVDAASVPRLGQPPGVRTERQCRDGIMLFGKVKKRFPTILRVPDIDASPPGSRRQSPPVPTERDSGRTLFAIREGVQQLALAPVPDIEGPITPGAKPGAVGAERHRIRRPDKVNGIARALENL